MSAILRRLSSDDAATALSQRGIVDLVPSLVLANLLTCVFFALIWLNVRLFSSYASELMYSVLLAEALWVPRDELGSYLTKQSNWSLLTLTLAWWAATLTLLYSGFFWTFFVTGIVSVAFTACLIGGLSVGGLAALLCISAFCFSLIFVGALTLTFSIHDFQQAQHNLYAWSKDNNEWHDRLLTLFSSLNNSEVINLVSGKFRETTQNTVYAPMVQSALDFFGNPSSEGLRWPSYDVLSETATELYAQFSFSSFFSSAVVKTANNAALALLQVVAFTTSLFDSAIRVAVSSSLLYFLLSSEEPMSHIIIERLKLLFPERKEVLQEFKTNVRRTIEAALIFPLALATLNALITAFVFIMFNASILMCTRWGFDLNLQFLWSPVLASVLTFVITPLAPPVCAIAPWVLQLALTGNIIQSLFVFVFAFVAYNVVYTYLLDWFYNHRKPQERNHERHFVYLTHLAFFLGVSAFGLQGLVVGPLCVCVADSSMKFLVKNR